MDRPTHMGNPQVFSYAGPYPLAVRGCLPLGRVTDGPANNAAMKSRHCSCGRRHSFTILSRCRSRWRSGESHG